MQPWLYTRALTIAQASEDVGEHQQVTATSEDQAGSWWHWHAGGQYQPVISGWKDGLNHSSYSSNSSNRQRGVALQNACSPQKPPFIIQTKSQLEKRKRKKQISYKPPYCAPLCCTDLSSLTLVPLFLYSIYAFISSNIYLEANISLSISSFKTLTETHFS